MRIMPLCRYYMRRHVPAILIYTAIGLAMTLFTLFMMVNVSSNMVVDVSGGDLSVYETGMNSNLYNDPSGVVVSGNFSMMIVIVALLLIKRNRELMTTLSVTRYEQIVGGFVYLLIMSAGLTILSEWLVPMLTFLVMAVFSLPVRGGWSAVRILTLGSDNLLLTMYKSFIMMIASFGLLTLLGYIFQRWWKIILIAFAALTLGAIIAFSQYSTSRFITYVLENAEQIADYILDVVVPFFGRMFDSSNVFLYTLRFVGFSVVCTLISYPIMRRMPVR